MSEITASREMRINPLQQALSSCCGAIITSFIVTPLDVIKIRMQVQQKQFKMQNKCFLYCNGLMDHICSCGPLSNQPWSKSNNGQFTSTKDAFIKIVRNEGVGSLWSGLGPTLVLAVPATIVYFVSYEQLKYRFKDMYYKKYQQETPQGLPWFIPLCSGGCARLIATTVVNPLELIRTKMQSQKMNYLEVNQALKLLIKSDGLRGLWRGVVPTLLRDVPFSSVYWVCYETMKSLFNTNQPSPGVSFISGMTAGAIAATLTTPFDVVKTYQQIEFGEKILYSNDGNVQQSSGNTTKITTTTLQRFKIIYFQHGIPGLFSGLVPRVIKVAPACAIMITSFEYGKKFFHNLSTNDKRYVNTNDKQKNLFNSSNEQKF